MLFNSILASALIGLSAAVPLAKSPAYKFRPGGNFAWQPVNGKSANTPSSSSSEASSPITKRIGPVVTRAFNNVLGVQKKRDARHVDVAALSWEQVKTVFVDSSVEALFEADEGRDADAAVCVGVGYLFGCGSEHDGDSASFRLRADGLEEQYDCFVLEGPTTFTVPASTSDSETVAVKFGG